MTARLSLFAAILVLASPTALRAQCTPSKPGAGNDCDRPFNDPREAQWLSIVPGLGYIYTGEYFRAYLTWVGTTGGLLMGSVVYQMDNCAFQFFTPCTKRPNTGFRNLGALMVAGGATAWIHSIFDAPRSAERANRRRVRPVVVPPQGATGAWRLGLTLGSR